MLLRIEEGQKIGKEKGHKKVHKKVPYPFPAIPESTHNLSLAIHVLPHLVVHDSTVSILDRGPLGHIQDTR